MSKKRALIFTKKFSNDKYELLFNEMTGFEILQGVNGYPDPFYLELPSLLDIGVMGTCQNKCKFCYQGHINRPNMKLDDFKKIIDQTKHHVNQVALGGRGDPNKHENFKEILVYCRANGKDHTFKAIKDLTNAGIRVCIHSIYSKHSHDRAIKILQGYDVWNGKVDLDNLFSVLFLLFKPQGAGKNLDWNPTSSQLKEFSNHIFRPKSKFMVGIDSCLVNKILNYEKPDKIQSLSIDTCEGARQSAYISPDMKMMPCSFANPKFFAVNITDKQDIYNIWNHSKVFTDFRSSLTFNPRKCPLF